MEEWLKEPGLLGTHATIGADLSQIMATLFPALFVIGWLQARRHQGHRHHWLMLGGMLAMIAFFTSYYLFRQLGVLALEGREGFGGPEDLYQRLFVPLLTVHIVLVTLGLVLAVYMIVLGFRAQGLSAGRRILQDDALVASWPRMALHFGWIAAAVILLFVVRTISTEFSLQKLAVYLGLLVLIAFLFSFEVVIQRIWPSGARRHRVVGRVTVWIYVGLFVTGSFIYAMLYVFYPGTTG